MVNSFFWTHGLVNQLSFHYRFPSTKLWFCKTPLHYSKLGFCQKDCWKCAPSNHDSHLWGQNLMAGTEKWCEKHLINLHFIIEKKTSLKKDYFLLDLIDLLLIHVWSFKTWAKFNFPLSVPDKRFCGFFFFF